jgi:hypothetical protein
MSLEATYPHIVEMKVPPNGFGRLLNIMIDWHHAQGIRALQGPGRLDEDLSFIRWCFASADHADAFQAKFGGNRLGLQ